MTATSTLDELLLTGLWGFRRVAFSASCDKRLSVSWKKSAGVYESLLGKFIFGRLSPMPPTVTTNVSNAFRWTTSQKTVVRFLSNDCAMTISSEKTFDENEEPVGRWDSWIRPLSCFTPQEDSTETENASKKAVPKPKGVKPKKRN
jgi:hypothetical protein